MPLHFNSISKLLSTIKFMSSNATKSRLPIRADGFRTRDQEILSLLSRARFTHKRFHLVDPHILTLLPDLLEFVVGQCGSDDISLLAVV